MMRISIDMRKVLILLFVAGSFLPPAYSQNVLLLPDTIAPVLPDSGRNEELITVGYATGNHRTLSGSVNRVNEKGMNEGLVSTPLDALRGRVSGVSIPVGGNSAAALAAVRVRGTTSLTGGNDPLVIIDGVSADLNLLSSIYPADIENFTILKDATRPYTDRPQLPDESNGYTTVFPIPDKVRSLNPNLSQNKGY